METRDISSCTHGKKIPLGFLSKELQAWWKVFNASEILISIIITKIPTRQKNLAYLSSPPTPSQLPQTFWTHLSGSILKLNPVFPIRQWQFTPVSSHSSWQSLSISQHPWLGPPSQGPCWSLRAQCSALAAESPMDGMGGKQPLLSHSDRALLQVPHACCQAVVASAFGASGEAQQQLGLSMLSKLLHILVSVLNTLLPAEHIFSSQIERKAAASLGCAWGWKLSRGSGFVRTAQWRDGCSSVHVWQQQGSPPWLVGFCM